MYSSRFVAMEPPLPEERDAVTYYSEPSDRDARPEFDHPLRQQIEVFSGRRAVALHPAEQLPPPCQQAGPGRARDGRFAEKERRCHRLERESMAGEELQASAHVGFLHETIAQQRLIDAAA